jgi:hypothetical protein
LHGGNVTNAEEMDLGLLATALSRRTALQVGGTVAGGLTVWALVPSLMRAGPPAAQPLTTLFGDVTVLAATLVSAAQVAGGRPLRHGVWRDALTASVALRNRTPLPQMLPSGQFRARVLGGPAVTAYDASPHRLTVPPRSSALARMTFLVPHNGAVDHLEFTEPGAVETLRLDLPVVTAATRRIVPINERNNDHHGGWR